MDGIPDNETVPCTLTQTVTPGPDDNTDPSEEQEEEAGPFREDAMDRTSAQVFLVLLVLAAIGLAGALGLMLYNSRMESAGTVLVDDAADLDSEGWGDEETVAPQGAVILDGTSVGPNAGSDAREVAVGRDDGVFGAPQLDGYNFPGWSPQQVQEALDAGWTVEQLREKYDSEQ